MKFLNVVPFIPGDVEFMADEMRRIRRETGLDTPAVSMTLHPEGLRARDKSEYFIAAFARLHDLLKNDDLKVGILLQTLLGHGWSSSGRCEEDFQLTININGNESGRFCPLDKGFLDYCRQTVKNLAELKPEFFLLDDDTRLINNAELECFCPLHLAKFSRKYTKEELCTAIKNAKYGDAVLQEFEEIRRRSLEDFCRNIREAIDEVDDTIPCGICGSGRELLMFERMALALSNAKTEPLVRVGNALYMETDPKDFSRRLYHTALNVKACGKVKNIIDESDTFPQNLYSKSSVSMHAHITGGILHKLHGGKLWIASFSNPKTAVNRAYEKSMHDYLPFYETLEKSVENICWQGPATPLVDMERNFHPWPYPEYFTWPMWQCDMLNRFGLPGVFASEPNEASVWMFSDNMTDYYSDEEMTKFFHKNLLLDSVSAKKLTRRGFAPLMGVEAAELNTPVRGEFNNINSEYLTLNRNKFCALLKPLSSEVKEFSKLYHMPYTQAPKQEYAAPGSIGFTNKYGGRVVICAGSVSSGFIDNISPFRKHLLTQQLDFLTGNSQEFYALNEQDLYVRYGIMANGEALAAVINFNFDPLSEIAFHLENKPEQIFELMPDGTWRNLDFVYQNKSLILQKDLPIYKPLIIKII